MQLRLRPLRRFLLIKKEIFCYLILDLTSKKIWYATQEGGCSNDVLVVKAGKTVDSKFLYYVLSDNNFFNYSTVTSKGTKMPRGSKNAIMKYWVPNLDLPTQKRLPIFCPHMIS